jgi:hypothetical protein
MDGSSTTYGKLTRTYRDLVEGADAALDHFKISGTNRAMVFVDGGNGIG